jgi:hypothetical protein
LTTVAVPTVEAAELAVSLLRELVERSGDMRNAARSETRNDARNDAHRGAQKIASEAPRVCVTSEPRLMVRGSTCAPRGTSKSSKKQRRD